MARVIGASRLLQALPSAAVAVEGSNYLSFNRVQPSATAAVAYRAGERIACEREGRVPDYRAKAGVEASFIVWEPARSEARLRLVDRISDA